MKKQFSGFWDMFDFLFKTLGKLKERKPPKMAILHHESGGH